MDKKTGIIVGIISAIILMMLVVVFAMDAKVKETPSDIIAKVNGVDFKVDDFKKYVAYKYYESGDATVPKDEETMSLVLNEYLLNRMYYTKALENGVKLPEEEKDYQAEYAEKAEKLGKFGISAKDYQKLEEEKSIVQTFQNTFSDYYDVPQETYQSIIDEYKEKDLYNTYSFRVMQIPYTNPESGDAGSGEEVAEENKEEALTETETTAETSETVDGVENANPSGELTEEEKKDTSKETQKVLAEDILSRLRAGEKSGETFEDLSREYGTYRFTFVGNGYNLVNGDIEYATGPIIKSKLGNSDEVFDAFIRLNPGEYTEVFDQPTYNAFQIVKMETKEEGFVGQGEKELKDVLIEEMKEDLVVGDSTYQVNQVGYINAIY